MSKVAAVTVAFVVIVGGIFVFYGRFAQPKYENISAQEAERLIAGGSVTVIDVREPFEYNEGHIPGAILIPLGIIQSKLASLDPNASYLLVCRSGNRSGQAASFMVAQGFKNVRNLSGGMLAWRGKVER